MLNLAATPLEYGKVMGNPHRSACRCYWRGDKTPELAQIAQLWLHFVQLGKLLIEWHSAGFTYSLDQCGRLEGGRAYWVVRRRVGLLRPAQRISQ